jgi:hypothetical protein
MSASTKRSGVNPVGRSIVATMTADTPAWLTSSGPPPMSSAAPIDNATTSMSTAVPVPSHVTMRSATAMPTATPSTSSIARRVRCPRAAESEMTAEIGAKNGLWLIAEASVQLAPTAIVVWEIVHAPLRRRFARRRTWARSAGTVGRCTRAVGTE